MAEHCGIDMLQVYERRSSSDRFDLALTVETIDTLHQCEHCGAKLTTHLEQPMRDSETYSAGGERS